MEARATYDDVNLLIRLYDLRREERLRAARNWFVSSCKPHSVADLEALCPPGSEQNAHFRQVVSYWEMAASFITAGVLNQELFFQSGHELLMVWERLRGLVAEYREKHKNPVLLKNLETVGKAYAQWMNRQSPEMYPAFAARARGEQG